MTNWVESVQFRGILDSRRKTTVEAEVRLADGSRGIASAPVAIAPGRAERARTELTGLGSLDAEPALAEVRDRVLGAAADSQAEFDALLTEIAGDRANVTVTLSMAFARARCAVLDVPLCAYIAAAAGTEPELPVPLVNVFSGGIHGAGPGMPFQEIMVAPRAGSFADRVRAALAVFAEVESWIRAAGQVPVYSTAGGLLVDGMHFEDAVAQLSVVIEDAFPETDARIGVDVAAEHLRSGEDGYTVAGRELSQDELSELLSGLCARFPIGYLEDPFDPADVPSWKSFTALRPAGLSVCGDDLFVTDERRMSAELADCAVIKLTQCGTLTAGVRAAVAARTRGMTLCVSHRSGETEDCGVCDLAVGLAAEFVKVGGPSADRMAKYNQFLRLSETLPVTVPTTTPSSW
jgi:enolase